jgi:hypothetical protein
MPPAIAKKHIQCSLLQFQVTRSETGEVELKHLLAYAYLMANFDRGAKTPLQVLQGVVARSLARAKEDRSASEISGDILGEWGLSIPIKVIRYSLSSLIGQDAVERKLNERRQEETFCSKMPLGLRVALDAEDKAAREKYDRIKSKVTAELFREKLNNKYSSDEVIEAWLDKSAISFLGNDASARGPDFHDLEINRIIAKVIGLDRNVDEDALTDLTDLAVGDVLYRSLRELTEYEVEQDSLPPSTRHDKSVDVFLDVGIISRAFGYYGAEQKIAVEQMLKMMRDVGFTANVFQHTVEELQEVISAAAARMQPGGADFRGPMISYAIRTGKTPSDLIREATNAHRNCADMGVKVVERPSPQDELTLRELALDHDVKVYVKQDNPRARQRDVDSLTSIFRLRRGEAKKSIDTCEAIFVTHNRALQAAAHHFFKEHFLSEDETNVVQLCMTDVVFSSRLWVKLPTSVDWKPRAQIIACALSNLAPAPGIREGFLQRLRELVTTKRLDPETATLVEFSRFTQEILALDYSHGDIFSDDSVNSVVLDVIQKMNLELSDARREGRRQGIEEEAERFKAFLAAHEGAKVLEQAEIRELRNSVSRSERDMEVARNLSLLFGKIIMGFLLAVLISGTLFTVLITLEFAQPKGALMIAALTAVALFFMTWFGLDRVKMLQNTVAAVEQWLLRRLAHVVE